MRTIVFGSALLVTAMMVGVARSGEIKSGPDVGAKAGAFQVLNVTGKNCAVDYLKDERGKLCYR